MGLVSSRETSAATKVQAVYRGHAARETVRMHTMRGVVLMRVNLPRSYRTDSGISGPLEVFEPRFLAFAERHLVVSHVPGGCFARGGDCDFVVECNSIERVRREPTHPPQARPHATHDASRVRRTDDHRPLPPIPAYLPPAPAPPPRQVYIDSKEPGVFAIARVGKERDLIFNAPDQQTRDDWVAALQKLSTFTSDVR